MFGKIGLNFKNLLFVNKIPNHLQNICLISEFEVNFNEKLNSRLKLSLKLVLK